MGNQPYQIQGIPADKSVKNCLPLLSPNQKKELAQFVRDFEAGDIPADVPCTTLFRGQYFIPPQVDQPLTEIREGALYFCLEQRLVTVRGQIITLTVKEFEIFALLILNPKRVFTYEMLLDLVWHEDYTYYSRKAINNHISNLRKKIRIAPDLPEYVKSVYGVGYKFEVQKGCGILCRTLNFRIFLTVLSLAEYDRRSLLLYGGAPFYI